MCQYVTTGEVRKACSFKKTFLGKNTKISESGYTQSLEFLEVFATFLKEIFLLIVKISKKNKTKLKVISDV